MPRIFAQPSSVKLPQRKGESKHEQYGTAHKGIVLCSSCYNIFAGKKWHAPESALVQHAMVRGKNIDFHLCPACTMARDHTFEGELIIKNIPQKYDAEIVHLVAASGARATAMDPQDRILSIQKRANGYRVRTSENQLAVKIAKKIKSSFKKKIVMHISYADEPSEVSRILVTFQSKKKE